MVTEKTVLHPYNVHVIWTFTNKWNKNGLVDLIRLTLPILIRRIRRISNHWFLNAELKNGRYHYHSMITLEDTADSKYDLEILIHYWNNKYGFTKVVQSSTYDNGYNYCIKDKNVVIRKVMDLPYFPDTISNDNYCGVISNIGKPVTVDNEEKTHYYPSIVDMLNEMA